MFLAFYRYTCDSIELLLFIFNSGIGYGCYQVLLFG